MTATDFRKIQTQMEIQLGKQAFLVKQSRKLGGKITQARCRNCKHRYKIMLVKNREKLDKLNAHLHSLIGTLNGAANY